MLPCCMSDDMSHNTSEVRLTMFLHGDSVRTHRNHNTRNEERSPLKGAVVSGGLNDLSNRTPLSMSNLSRRGAWDGRQAMVCRGMSGGEVTDMD